MRRAAEQQALATERAAREQAAAISAASVSQVSLINQQAQGAAMAMQQSMNQANLASKLRTQEQQNAQAPETRLSGSGASDPDPRRKYRRADGGSLGGMGGSNGGMGIKL